MRTLNHSTTSAAPMSLAIPSLREYVHDSPTGHAVGVVAYSMIFTAAPEYAVSTVPLKILWRVDDSVLPIGMSFRRNRDGDA